MAALMLAVAMVIITGCNKEEKATIETSQATNVTSNSATVGGVITSDGNSAVLERGVCWSKNSNPDVSDNHMTSGTGMGSFTCDLTGLEEVTTYYVKAYAINNVGISYGAQATFTTLTGNGGGDNPGGGGDNPGGGGNGGGDNPADLPVVTTSEVTAINASTAQGGGTVASNGASDVTDRGICWGTSHNPTLSDSHVSCGAGTGSFTGEITGLEVETTYYVRAYATNASGTAYGDEVSFVTVNPGGVPEGALSGKFNAGQRMIYFSKGNLQYQPSSNTWRFAEHQWDLCDGNGYASSYYNGWLDIFAWGTSGYNHGAVHYEPWSMTSSDSEYYAYGDDSYNLYDQTGQADWGYNAISNGGNTSNVWNTLTADEWEYIVNVRHTPTDIRYAKAIVNHVVGLILLPDDWETSTYTLSGTNQSNYGFYNIISLENWAILEEAGAVFLPGQGSQYSGHGEYWSSSVRSTTYGYGVYSLSYKYINEYGSHVEYNHVNPKSGYYSRNNRCAVRLVQTVN